MSRFYGYSKIVSSFLFVVVLCSFQMASAGKISDLKTAKCTGEQENFLNLDTKLNLLYANVVGLGSFSSDFNEPKSVLEKYVWVREKLYGFGNFATSHSGGRSFLFTLLYTAEQENNLPETGSFDIWIVDMYGTQMKVPMKCQLTF